VNAAVLSCLLAVAAFAPDGVRGSAAPPPPLPVVEATGACPGADAVRAALLPLAGQVGPQPAGMAAHVTDLGSRFQIAAAGQSGLFIDAGRDCAERARVAAVFIALALNPPTLQARAPVPPAAAPAPASGAAAVAAPAAVRDGADLARAMAPVATPPPSRRWFALAVVARLDGASTDGAGAVDVGGGPEVRAAAGRGAFGAAAGASLLSPTTKAFGSVPVRERRFPFSLSATARHALPARLAIAGDLGVALVPFTLQGQQLGAPAPATRLDVGAHVAVALRLPPVWGWVAPVFDVHADYFPRTYELSVNPLGTIGSSSHLWLGASLGLSFERGTGR
jgi:hypothetical protein